MVNHEMSDQSSKNGLAVRGLEGVSVGETRIALVDGENGRLIYHGHDAEELAQEATFEQVAYLLWHGQLPEDDELDELHGALINGLRTPDFVLDAMRSLEPDALAMDVLRTGLSAWGASRHKDGGGDEEDALWALGAVAAIVADHERLRQGQDVVEPDPSLRFVDNYLLKLTGERPDASRARALDAYFTLAAEHGMNASTFTARVIVSTESDLASGLVGAIGALKGRLHGGAPSHVTSMLEEIGTQENAEPWLRKKIEAGERLMGFGHRVYKTYDPRARALGKVAEQLGGEDQRFALARHVEETAIRLLEEYKPGRRLYTNVEYYAAAVLGGVNLPPGLYTATFAAARTAGWTAHILEQLANNRLIRPTVDYVGPMPS
jgi:citrate synthase